MNHFNPLWEQSAFINNDWVKAGAAAEVLDKFDNSVIGVVAHADETVTHEAVAAAEAAFKSGSIHPYLRYEILSRGRELIAEREEQILHLMVGETGFTLGDCRTEFNRCLQTFAASAEEAKRLTGEMVPITAAPGQDERRIAFTVRKPIGVVCAITPFNSPLNTVAHKVLPAIAAGNTVVLKPATYTPLCSAVLCEVLAEAGLPPGYLNMVTGGGSTTGRTLLHDQRIAYYAFTGSTEVGREIQQAAGLRRTQLELGNISGTIVCADATLELAVSKCAAASFRKAGQVCTSVQRIFAESSLVDEFVDALCETTRSLAVGNPRNESTFVGPMIDRKEAQRIENWIVEADREGAEILTGGGRDGALVQPTVITGASYGARILTDEAFAPVVTVVPFDSLDEALAGVNATPYGLAAGIFTNDITRGLEAIRALDMGNIHINDTSSSRVDLMPYGGIKDSGHGREGPRYSVRDMTEEQLVVINPG